jgi:hypothetical protein
MSGTGQSLLLALSDGTCEMWRTSGEPHCVYAFPTYREQVVCSGGSQSLQIVVVGASDGTLVFANRADGRVVRSVQIGCTPVKILVTPLWGFVLVLGCEWEEGNAFYSLILLNLNGVFIRKVQFPGLIREWVAWTSRDDFDFVLVAAEKGRLFSFEAFFLEIGSPVQRFKLEIIGLQFATRANVIVVLEADGTLHVIPFTSKEIEKGIGATGT